MQRANSILHATCVQHGGEVRCKLIEGTTQPTVAPSLLPAKHQCAPAASCCLRLRVLGQTRRHTCPIVGKHTHTHRGRHWQAHNTGSSMQGADYQGPVVAPHSCNVCLMIRPYSGGQHAIMHELHSFMRHMPHQPSSRAAVNTTHTTDWARLRAQSSGWPRTLHVSALKPPHPNLCGSCSHFWKDVHF